MKFLHIADIHYGYNPNFKFFSKRNEIAETFERILTFSNNNSIDFILCAGDLIDSETISFSELMTLRDLIAGLACPFYCVTGNHDPLGKNSVYNKMDMPSNFRLAPAGQNEFLLPQFNTVIHTYSWDQKAISTPFSFNKRIDPAQVNILLLHADTAKSSNYLPVDIRELNAKNFDYVALGHIHKRFKINENTVYAGSPEPLDRSETGKHGFYLCTLEKGVINSAFIPFAKREIIEKTVFCAPEESMVTIKNKISEIIDETEDNCILCVCLKGLYNPQAPINANEIEAYFSDKNRIVLIEDKTEPDFDVDALYKENKENLIGRFIASFGDRAELHGQEQDALKYGLCALLGYGEEAI